MAQDFNRFEQKRKGYDPQAVEKELNALNQELARLLEQNTELNQQLKNTRTQLNQAEAKLKASEEPNFSALGAKAAELIASAESIALELTHKTKQELLELRLTADNELAELKQKAEQEYSEQLSAAARRSARAIATAKHEAELLLANASEESRQKRSAAEREIAKLRGMAATEVAAIRSAAVRELELRRAQLEKKLAQKRFLQSEQSVDEKALEQVEAKFELTKAEQLRALEQELYDRHGEAVRQTEQYLESAKQDLAGLQQAAALLRLEIQALELDAGRTQSRLIQEARDKAEAIIHAAELEAGQLKLEAEKAIAARHKAAQLELNKIDNRVASSEIYLENLRSVVAKEFSQED